MRCSKKVGDVPAGVIGVALHLRELRMRRSIAIVLGTVVALLAGCSALDAQRPGTLDVRHAQVRVNAGSATLELDLDCRLSGPMRDALDHGIPLTLQIDASAGRWPTRTASVKRRIELRYFPLSRRYQLRELQTTDVRSFASPAYLMAALSALHIDLPAEFANLPPATALQVSARLDPTALPGPLRLPALFEPAWHLASAGFAWSEPAR